MIEQKLIIDYYVHIGENKIISKKYIEKPKKEIDKTVVVCENCGASNAKEINKISKCEYCLSNLKS